MLEGVVGWRALALVVAAGALMGTLVGLTAYFLNEKRADGQRATSAGPLGIQQPYAPIKVLWGQSVSLKDAVTKMGFPIPVPRSIPGSLRLADVRVSIGELGRHVVLIYCPGKLDEDGEIWQVCDSGGFFLLVSRPYTGPGVADIVARAEQNEIPYAEVKSMAGHEVMLSHSNMNKQATFQAGDLLYQIVASTEMSMEQVEALALSVAEQVPHS